MTRGLHCSRQWRNFAFFLKEMNFFLPEKWKKNIINCLREKMCKTDIVASGFKFWHLAGYFWAYCRRHRMTGIARHYVTLRGVPVRNRDRVSCSIAPSQGYLTTWVNQTFDEFPSSAHSLSIAIDAMLFILFFNITIFYRKYSHKIP